MMRQIGGYMDLLQHQERRKNELELHPYYQELTKKVKLSGAGSPQYTLNIDIIKSAIINSFDGINDNSLAGRIDDFLGYCLTQFHQLLYEVNLWITPGFEYHTERVIGMPNPIWNEKFSVRFDPYGRQQFLHVEVIRHSSPSDIGTSFGVEVMGRARISVPSEIDESFVGEFELVRQYECGCRPEGIIYLEMKVIME